MVKKEVKPIKFVKTDKENGHISKEEFIAKRRKQKAIEAKMKAYEAKAREEVEEEMSGAVDEPIKQVEEQPTETSPQIQRRGRPRKGE